MAIAAALDLEVRQYDTVNAFVNSKPNEDVHCYPQRILSSEIAYGYSSER